MRRRRHYVSAEEFIKCFMKHEFSLDVAEELGMKIATVQERASKLRKMGVKLPYRSHYIRKPKEEFVDEMNQLISQIEVNDLATTDSGNLTERGQSAQRKP